MIYEFILLKVRSKLLIKVQLQADCLRNFIFTVFRIVMYPAMLPRNKFPNFLLASISLI